ncbi:fatty-acid amide hydrolase (amidase) [Colletotrichum truncatum]|uniref:Fatty-acid amide hydrolase (Amidase) n=1 Tax=Colletotrichum truncatum TaxID=5467 RepID=A0ACC3YU13_COLTU|nr:fatty-acid amide hydrolase (amidase) [Colletotrichum truncatum]KAF6782128.1 fatty-acid amide hydrolase (amidase) [Colletotrichum truncatum]
MGSLKSDSVAPWELASAKKRKALLSTFPSEWCVPKHLLPPESQKDVTTWPETSGWFTETELAITNSTAAELLPKLASGHLKSSDVTRAFCKRAVAAHQLTNCLSETCFDRAFATAKALDEHLERTGTPLGPFHGLPISLKDNFNLKGLDATVGFASHVGSPAEYDAVLATLLEEAGAVFYVKTNVPTAMMIAESVNNVFGRTVNPRNRDLTSGGSSGGESALIAMKGSPLGIGTDIGGSLRIPAACTGIFTLRPSFGRFPTLGCRSGMGGQEAVQSVNGPMTRTITDLELYSKSVINRQTWCYDPRCVPIAWREVELPATLRIAVMWDDGIVRPTPPVTRALRLTVDKLKEAGVEIIDWDPKDQEQGVSLLNRMFVADGGISIKKELDKTGEPWRPEMAAYSLAKELGTYDMWQLHLERTAFQKRYLDRWNAAGIDAILCPTTPFTSVKNGTFKHVGYTGVYNVLDYSCVSFPTGLSADESLDLVTPTEKPLGPVCEAISAEYDANAVHGMPISLQLVASRLEEEKAIAMVKHILNII